MSFFTELKRRNVYKVGVAYAIVAWLLIQIAGSVLPTFDAPRWVLQTITFVIILGFPLAIFFAWAFELTPEGIKATTPEGPAQYHTRTTGHRLNYFILGVLILAVGFMLVDNYVLVDRTQSSVASPATPFAKTPSKTEVTQKVTSPAQGAASAPVQVRLTYLPVGVTQPMGPTMLDTYIALSRDGRRLVYAAQKGDTRRLYDRQLNQLTAQPISGTEKVWDACFSPNGEWVAYETDNGLYKVAVTGGEPQKLIKRTGYARGAWWSADHVIYFTIYGKLNRISANGGKPEEVQLQSEYAKWFQSWPQGLPDGTHLLLTVSQKPLNAKDGDTALLNLKTGKTRLLIRDAYNARYVPGGHIAFMRAGSLWAVPFDAKQLNTTGPEVPVVNDVESAGELGQAIYAFADDGWLIYLPGGDVSVEGYGLSQPVWVDRHGKVTPLDVKPAQFNEPRLSPDDKQVSLTLGIPGVSSDIWTLNLTRGTLSKRTFGGDTFFPVWSIDGKHLAYTFSPNFHGLAWTRSDGAGQPENLLDVPLVTYPNSFTPDGSQLIYTEQSRTGLKIHVLSMNKDHTDRLLLAKKYYVYDGVLSPDGKWLAYISGETGRSEIYVRPYPNVDNGKWQISIEGGDEPYWRGDGKELYYRSLGSPVAIMAVTVNTESGFHVGKPVKLFQGDFFINPNTISYDVTTDGQHFLMLKSVKKESKDKEASGQQTNLVVVDNWFAELKRLAPPSQ